MGAAISGGLIPVSQLIEDAVVWVSPHASLEGVADLLGAGEIGALVVGDGTLVEGIVTERDIVHAVAQRKDLRETTAADVANSKLLWCDPSSTVSEVAQEMLEHYVRHVLVQQDGGLGGIVSARDLLGAYTASAELEEELGT